MSVHLKICVTPNFNHFTSTLIFQLIILCSSWMFKVLLLICLLQALHTFQGCLALTLSQFGIPLVWFSLIIELILLWSPCLQRTLTQYSIEKGKNNGGTNKFHVGLQQHQIDFHCTSSPGNVIFLECRSKGETPSSFLHEVFHTILAPGKVMGLLLQWHYT